MLAGIGEASRVLIYNLIASVVLPAMFVAAAALVPADGFVAVAWGWAIGYPIAFAALLAMALPRAGLGGGAYARAIGGIVACAGVALAVGAGARRLLPEPVGMRAFGVGVAVLASYALMLARVERVTPAAIVRSFRSASATDERQ
jgi:hypothetical protein